jgi:hypothetical protein
MSSPRGLDSRVWYGKSAKPDALALPDPYSPSGTDYALRNQLSATTTPSGMTIETYGEPLWTPSGTPAPTIVPMPEPALDLDTESPLERQLEFPSGPKMTPWQPRLDPRDWREGFGGMKP